MLSTRKILAGVAGLVLTTSTIAAVSASADTGEAAACTVTGSVTSSGIGLLPTNNTFGFTSVQITCTGAPGSDDAGSWTVNVVTGTGATTMETCGEATSIAASLSGSGPEGTLTGSLDPTTSVRVGADVIVNGTINTGSGASAETHSFHGHLIFQPTNGVCAGGSGNTTAADIVLGSSAVVTE